MVTSEFLSYWLLIGPRFCHIYQSADVNSFTMVSMPHVCVECRIIKVTPLPSLSFFSSHLRTGWKMMAHIRHRKQPILRIFLVFSFISQFTLQTNAQTATLSALPSVPSTANVVKDNFIGISIELNIINMLSVSNISSPWRKCVLWMILVLSVPN